MGFRFTTTHNGETDTLGLASELERFANCQWVGDHYTLEQATALVMDRFKRMIEQQLQLIDLQAEKETD